MFDILLAIAGATLGLLLAVLMMGMLVPRANTLGVLCGMVAGMCVFGIIRIVIPNMDPQQLEQIGPLAGLARNTWWDGMFTTIPALVVGLLVSFGTAAPREEQLRGLLLRGASED